MAYFVTLVTGKTGVRTPSLLVFDRKAVATVMVIGVGIAGRSDLNSRVLNSNNIIRIRQSVLYYIVHLDLG